MRGIIKEHRRGDQEKWRVTHRKSTPKEGQSIRAAPGSLRKGGVRRDGAQTLTATWAVGGGCLHPPEARVPGGFGLAYLLSRPRKRSGGYYLPPSGTTRRPDLRACAGLWGRRPKIAQPIAEVEGRAMGAASLPAGV